MKNFINKFDHSLLILISILLAAVVLLSLFTITARYFNLTLLWIEPLSRHLVLILTFLGATLAIAHNRHIKVDLLSKVLEKIDNQSLFTTHHYFTLLVTIIFLSILLVSAYLFASVEWEYGTTSFLGLHSGALVSILPVGISLMIIRCLLAFFEKPLSKQD